MHTSPETPMAFTPDATARTSFVVSSTWLAVLPETATAAPDLAKARAISLPIPLPEPVTSATLPAREPLNRSGSMGEYTSVRNVNSGFDMVKNEQRIENKQKRRHERKGREDRYKSIARSSRVGNAPQS